VPYCPFQCFSQKEVNGIAPISGRNGKKNGFLDTDGAPLRGDANYHVPNGFADSKMGEIGQIPDTQLLFATKCPVTSGFRRIN